MIYRKVAGSSRVTLLASDRGVDLEVGGTFGRPGPCRGRLGTLKNPSNPLHGWPAYLRASGPVLG